MKRIVLALVLLLPLSIAYTSVGFADDAGVSATPSSATSAPTPSGSAAPAAVPTLPDPVEHPVDAAKAARDEVAHFGYLWGGMMVLWGIGVALIKANDERHWLAQDHRLSIGVSVIGIIGAILDAKFGGGSLMTVVGAIGAAITLVLQKPTPGKSSTAPA